MKETLLNPRWWKRVFDIPFILEDIAVASLLIARSTKEGSAEVSNDLNHRMTAYERSQFLRNRP